MTDRDDAGEGPESAPRRESDAAEAAGAPAPRAARFGEGPEGRPARRERGGASPRDGAFERAGKFLRDVRAEMGRTTWPTALQVRNTTIITIIAVVFFALYLFVVDRGLTFAIDLLQRFVNWLFGGA